MEQQAPTVTKGVVIDQENKLSYSELPLRALEEGEVIVKVHSAPINPSDLGFLSGFYPTPKTKPTTAGFEGSGLVVAAGASEASQALVGKRVALFSRGSSHSGTYADYALLPNTSVFPLPDNLDYEQGSTCLVNPLTVEGFLHTCEVKGHTTIVHSAAASQLGRMLVAGAKENDITLINIVRRQGQVDILKDLGVDEALIINTGEENWKATAKAIFAEHNPTAFFDAVAGPVADEIIKLLPNESITYNYGNLSGKPISLFSYQLIFQQKIVTGWWLTHYIRDPKIGAVIFKNTFTKLAKRTFKSEIAERFTQDKYAEAIQFYKKNMSKGKVLIQNPNF